MIEQTGKTTTGIRVPDEILGQLGAGKRPRVVVTLDDGYSLRTTVGSHAGAPFISVAAAVREAAKVAAGDVVEVGIRLDTAPREVHLPDDLATALAEHEAVSEWFHQLTDSQRRVFVTSVISSKKPETRQRRVIRAVDALVAKQKRP